MRVELAEKAGFCFGVSRAVNTVYSLVEEEHDPVYTYGPIIHNEEVIADLEKKGVQVLDDDAFSRLTGNGTIVIRSHGVPKATMDRLQETGLKIVDATCPFVKKIHNIVSDYSSRGYYVIVVGNAAHPEVEGIVGWGNPSNISVVSSKEEAAAFDTRDFTKLCIVSQTTFNYNKFQDIVEILREMMYNNRDIVGKDCDFVVHNTICSATKERQEAASDLSKCVDAMIVIGGLSSSNTRKLYEICSENCLNTYFIQTKEDLKDSDLSRFDYVGITAGASTPNNIIEEVQKYVRVKF